MSVYGVSEDEIKSLNREYKKIRDGYQLKVRNTKEATRLIVEHQDLFTDYEVVKGGMDDVFLAVTGTLIFHTNNIDRTNKIHYRLTHKTIMISSPESPVFLRQRKAVCHWMALGHVQDMKKLRSIILTRISSHSTENIPAGQRRSYSMRLITVMGS